MSETRDKSSDPYEPWPSRDTSRLEPAGDLGSERVPDESVDGVDVPEPPEPWPFATTWPPALPPGAGLEPAPEHHHPLDRFMGPRVPRWLRLTIDWVVTIVGAVAIVLAVKAFVVNPYRIPSSSMEPTLHCARIAPGCEAHFSDRVLANRFLYRITDPKRGDVIVFDTPKAAQEKCGAGGTFVKRLIGLPGETVQIRLHRGDAYVYIDGRKLEEPYIGPGRRDLGPEQSYKVPLGHYFVMGDNRAQSCDSRVWGSVPRANLIGKVFMTYWPPNRISFR